jgi:hypothetical protein
MKEFLINEFLPQILPAIGIVLTAILVTIIKKIGNEAVEYISKKKEVAEQQLNSDKNKEILEFAMKAWNIVEEEFRVTENLNKFIGTKAEMFDKLLLEKFPILTEKQIAEIRQAIAGEINRGREALFKDTFKEEVKKIQEDNSKLIQENNDLKNKLNIISGVIPAEENQPTVLEPVVNTETVSNDPVM